MGQGQEPLHAEEELSQGTVPIAAGRASHPAGPPTSGWGQRQK